MKKALLRIALLSVFYMVGMLPRYVTAYPYGYESPIMDYLFTMMYFESGMQPCKNITNKPLKELTGAIDIMLLAIDTGIVGSNFNKNYVTEVLNNSYNYCLNNPNDMFGKALIMSSGINLGNLGGLSGNNSASQSPQRQLNENLQQQNPSSNGSRNENIKRDKNHAVTIID